jgi:hypothetical protein
VPTTAATLVRKLNGGGTSRSQRRNLIDRLENLAGRLGVEQIGEGNAKQWRRWTSSVTLMIGESRLHYIGVCHPTNKWCYGTEGEANTAVRQIRVQTRYARKRPRRSYRCPWCDCWHLTSQEGDTG